MSHAEDAFDLIPASIPLPRLYATEKIPIGEKIVHIKLFTPDSSWTWLLVEYDPAEDEAFGYSYDAKYPDGAEWGYISIAELRTIRGPMKLKVERDVWFAPQPFAAAARREFGIGKSDSEPVAEAPAPEPPPARPAAVMTGPEKWIEHSMCGNIQTTSTKNRWSADITAFAVAGGDLMAVSMVGAATALDAIRANATMGKPLTIVLKGSINGASQYPAATKDNRFALFKTRLPLIRRDHYILLNRLLLEPQLDEDQVYVMGHHGERECDIVGRGLRQYVPVAVLPQWYDWLYRENQKLGAMARVRQLSGIGFRIYAIPLKHCNWAELVKMGLQTNALTFEVQHGTR